MPAAETARLIASLELKDQFSGTAKKIDANLTLLDKKMTRAERAGRQVGVGIKNGAIIAGSAVGFLASQVGFGLNKLAQLEDETAQTNAALASTKGAAGQSAASIRALAEQYEALNATIDDTVIQSGENVLLTFTNIRKQAFEPALKAALDLSVGMKQDLQTSIVQVGKALNDPIKGLTSLTRIGVAFTSQQKEQIKALVKANDIYGAQQIILAELNKEFGGRFAAAGKTAKGTIASVGDAVEDLQKTLAAGLFPVLQRVLPQVRKALADPAVIKGVEDLGKSIAGLFSDENLAAGADFLKGAFQTAKEAAPIVADAAKATFSLVKSAVGLFKSLPPEVQKLAVGAFAINKLTGGLVTNLAGGIVGAILGQLKSAIVNVQGAVVNVGGVPGAGLAGAAGTAGKGGRLAGAVSTLSKVFIVGAAAGVFAELVGLKGEQTAANKAQEAGLSASTAVYVKSASLADMQKSLAGIEAYTRELDKKTGTPENLAYQLNIDGVRDSIDQQKRALQAAIASETKRLEGAAIRTKDDVTAAIQRQRDATDRVKDKMESARIAIVSAVSQSTAAARYAAQQQAAAIRDIDVRPKVTVNNQVRVSTTVSVSSLGKAQTTYRLYGNRYIS